MESIGPLMATAFRELAFLSPRVADDYQGRSCESIAPQASYFEPQIVAASCRMALSQAS
jgi:hypothetical protein